MKEVSVAMDEVKGHSRFSEVNNLKPSKYTYQVFRENNNQHFYSLVYSLSYQQ